MHGGNNPGPARGNQNAFKHGRRSAAAVAARKARVARSRQIMRDLADFDRLADLAWKADNGMATPAEQAEVDAFLERLGER